MNNCGSVKVMNQSKVINQLNHHHAHHHHHMYNNNNDNNNIMMMMNQQQQLKQQQQHIMMNNNNNIGAGAGGGGRFGIWPLTNPMNCCIGRGGFNGPNNWKVNNKITSTGSILNHNNVFKIKRKDFKRKASGYGCGKLFKNKLEHTSSSGAPYAPRNTSSFIIRAKKSGGGTASLVSPCAGTPMVLATPVFTPSREGLVDMAKEEWGVDGYGSMKGLIRLRSLGNEEEEEEEEGGALCESDVEEHLEVERRLARDLSRFEIVYPNRGNVLENRVDDQGTDIVRVEEENLGLKERLFSMEREVGDLRRRLLSLERLRRGRDEVVLDNNESENDSGSRGGTRSLEENNDDVIDEIEEAGVQFVKAKGDDGDVEDKNVTNVEVNEKKQ